MNPVSTALFLVGYGLAVPIATRLPTVVAERNRMAMWGHQVGVLVAALGWLLKGGVMVAVLHLAWIGLANVWFGFGTTARSRVGNRDR